jgi:hypothetical protein
MNTKQKFQRIDQSKLDEKQVGILKAISQKTNDFKTKDKEVLEKIDLAIDKIIAALEDKNPEALKPINAKKSTSKPKAKTSKATSKSAPSKPTAMSLAKEIRRADETWNEAVKRASEIMKNNKAQAKKTIDTELQKLLKIVRTRKELEGFKDSDILRDSVRTAKPRGKRVVTKQGFTSNQYGTFENRIGRKYWESRDGHADRLSPAYPKDLPLLENGGGIHSSDEMYQLNVYKGGTDEMIDTKIFRARSMREAQMIAEEDYEDIMKRKHGDYLRFEVVVAAPKMASGGGVSQKKYYVNFNVGKVKYMVSFHDGVQKHKDGSNFYDMRTFKNKKDFDAFIQKLEGEGYKELTPFEKLEAGGEFMTDPTFGNFQNQVYELGGNVMPDLAGHMGGKFGTGDPSMLNGFTGTHYDGLVGETGAMSAGELFMDGGAMMQNQAIIDAASQPYVNYYLGEGASAGIFKRGGQLKQQPTLKQLYIEQIASLTGTRVAAIEDFVSQEGLTDNEIASLTQALGTKKIKSSDFVVLIVGDKSTSSYKKTKSEVMKIIKSGKVFASIPKKYIDHDDIAYVNVMKGGKQVSYKGSDVFNGVNTFDDGGKLSSKANYISKRDVVSVTLKNGKTVTPANGYWVKKGAEVVNNTKKSFSNGGSFREKNEGFMEIDNERKFRSPFFNDEVEPVDIPMDLSSDYIGRKPLQDGLEEEIDLSEGRIRAIKTFSAGSPDKLLAVNPNAYEHLNLPKPNGKTHKND